MKQPKFRIGQTVIVQLDGDSYKMGVIMSATYGPTIESWKYRIGPQDISGRYLEEDLQSLEKEHPFQ